MKRTIRQRRRIYLGCEGESERAYGKRLNELTDEAGLHLAIVCEVLQPGSGDPLALIQHASRNIRNIERKRGVFEYKAVLLDSDKLGQTPDRDRRIKKIAEESDLHLIWQEPCHEAFLLRHFVGEKTRRPASSLHSYEALKKLWPDYQKPMSALKLAEYITLQSLKQATDVEKELEIFLHEIGMISFADHQIDSE